MSAVTQALADAVEIVPLTIAQNSAHPQATPKLMLELRRLHMAATTTASTAAWGLDGIRGCVIDTLEEGVVDSLACKLHAVQSAIGAVAALLNIDLVTHRTMPSYQCAS
jgi:chaperonin GroEL (HSP60 family)